MAEIIQAIAGADLSASSNQYLAVGVNGSSDDERVVLEATDTSIVGLGFLADTPGDNEVCKIQYSGIGTAIAGGAIEPYDLLMINASSQVILAAGATKVVWGQALPPLSGTTATGRDYAAGEKVRMMIFARKLVLG